MSWKKKGTIAILMAMPVAIIILFFLFFFSKKTIDPWSFIPENAALIVEINNPKVFYESISNKNDFWQSLLSVKEIEDINTILVNLDSLNSENFPVLKELFSSPLLLSLHPRTDSIRFSYLISISNNHLREKENLSSWAGQILNSSFDIVATSKSEDVLFIRRAGTENGAYIVVKGNNLLISSDYSLLEDITYQAKNDDFHFYKSTQFQQLKSTAGKYVDAHVFINYHFLHSIFSSYLNQKTLQSLAWMDNFAGWSVLDLLIKNDALLFSGFTDLNNSKQILANFSNDSPRINQIYKMLPSNTTFVLSYGTENISFSIEQNILSNLTDETGINMNAFLATLGKEICLASSATNNQMLKENSWVIAKLKDKKNANNYLSQLTINSKSSESFEFKGYTFKRIGFDNLLSQLFGTPFSLIDKNWYTVVNDYVVFANSTDALTDYIKSVELGKTLDLNENFIDFSNKLSTASNITLLIKPSSLSAFSTYYLDKTVTHKNGFLLTLLNSINMLSFQFSVGEPYFYTSFSLNHSTNFKEEKPYLWKFQLDAEINSSLFMLKDSKKIILQDELFTMYCVDLEGNLIWKKRLDSPVLGNIQEVINKKNQTKQLLFNTKDNLYQVNEDGEDFVGFPQQIKPSATNGLTIYINSNEYRILIAQLDKKIHNYTIEGKPVKGWKLPSMDNMVTNQITYISSKNKNFLVITDNDENIQIVNKFGVPIKIKKTINKAISTDFYDNKTNSKGEIITTNKQGKLTYISEKGKLQYTDFGNFGIDHYFIYEDFNGDKVIDFIYIDGNKLTVFDRFKKTLFSYTFNSEIKTAPIFYRINDQQILLAIVPENENSIYLFDNKGELTIFPNLPENAKFAINTTENGEVGLVVGDKKSIYFYRLR